MVDLSGLGTVIIFGAVAIILSIIAVAAAIGASIVCLSNLLNVFHISPWLGALVGGLISIAFFAYIAIEDHWFA